LSSIKAAYFATLLRAGLERFFGALDPASTPFVFAQPAEIDGSGEGASTEKNATQEGKFRIAVKLRRLTV
jgi:hypothetical protein